MGVSSDLIGALQPLNPVSYLNLAACSRGDSTPVGGGSSVPTFAVRVFLRLCELHESGRPRLCVLESLGAAKPKWRRWEPSVGSCGSLASGKDCTLDDLAARGTWTAAALAVWGVVSPSASPSLGDLGGFGSGRVLRRRQRPCFSGSSPLGVRCVPFGGSAAAKHQPFSDETFPRRPSGP